MKHTITTLTATAIVLACNVLFSQEQAQEENVEYEKLKVLEPIIGTWHAKSQDAGMHREYHIKYSWSDSKKIIEGEVTNRTSPADEDIAAQPFAIFARAFFVWNQQDERIERYLAFFRTGQVTVNEWIPKGNGVFAVKRLSSTSPRGTAEIQVTISNDKYTHEATNVKDADGTAQDDWGYSLDRVE
jgi:hypothetical protein